MIRDLSTFGLVESPQAPPEPPAPCSSPQAIQKSTENLCEERSRIDKPPSGIKADRTILITRDHPLTSWQRAWTVAMETRQKYPAVWITSNGSMDAPATEWQIRGVVEATN